MVSFLGFVFDFRIVSTSYRSSSSNSGRGPGLLFCLAGNLLSSFSIYVLSSSTWNVGWILDSSCSKVRV